MSDPQKATDSEHTGYLAWIATRDGEIALMENIQDVVRLTTSAYLAGRRHTPTKSEIGTKVHENLEKFYAETRKVAVDAVNERMDDRLQKLVDDAVRANLQRNMLRECSMAKPEPSRYTDAGPTDLVEVGRVAAISHYDIPDEIAFSLANGWRPPMDRPYAPDDTLMQAIQWLFQNDEDRKRSREAHRERDSLLEAEKRAAAEEAEKKQAAEIAREVSSAKPWYIPWWLY